MNRNHGTIFKLNWYSLLGHCKGAFHVYIWGLSYPRNSSQGLQKYNSCCQNITPCYRHDYTKSLCSLVKHHSLYQKQWSRQKKGAPIIPEVQMTRSIRIYQELLTGDDYSALKHTNMWHSLWDCYTLSNHRLSRDIWSSIYDPDSHANLYTV